MFSFSCKSWNKVLAETHESLRSTSGCVGSSFWLHISHLLLFLLAPSATAPRGVPAVPWMWRPVVALRFREARPVSVISLWETLSLEAKPSFLTFFSSDEQFSSRTWRFFLAFSSVSIVGIAFSGRPWELLAHTKELWLPFEGLI